MPDTYRELLEAAKAAADALGDAEHTMECEWGRLEPREKWEQRTQEGGPSEELYALRKAIMAADPAWKPRRHWTVGGR